MSVKQALLTSIQRRHDDRASDAKSLLDALTHPPEGLTFYESGSRAVAKRIGTDKFTRKQIDESYKNWVCDPIRANGGLKADPKQPYYWYDDKPILIEESTDYDFYCKNCPEAVTYLTLLGFDGTLVSTNKAVEGYCDDLCSAVFHHPTHPVQVVLRDDPLLYKAIFDNIPHQMFHDYLWKSSPKTVNRNDIREWFNTFAKIALAVQELK